MTGSLVVITLSLFGMAITGWIRIHLLEKRMDRLEKRTHQHVKTH